MGDVIKRIISSDNIERIVSRLVSPPSRMPAPPTPQRAGTSGLNVYVPPVRSRMDSSDEQEPERVVRPPHCPYIVREFTS